jgi:pimeloyl-ACP methyl ester carboxylesterase
MFCNGPQRCHNLTNTFGSIIAVHGLGSQVDWSWTWKDETLQANGQPRLVNWLKDSDMLPDIVPKTRILAYNYESRWHKDAPKTRLQACAEELVNEIHDFRKSTGTIDRPLIMIGHSLGGNVIQHVSTLSRIYSAGY